MCEAFETCARVGYLRGNLGTRFPPNPWTHRKFLKITPDNLQFVTFIVRYTLILENVKKCPTGSYKVTIISHPIMCTFLRSITPDSCKGIISFCFITIALFVSIVKQIIYFGYWSSYINLCESQKVKLVINNII